MKETFTEKYRPKLLKEIIGQEQHIEKFKGYVKKHTIPHLLFYGQAGVGKTTIARILVKELNASSLELNASDERGIDVVRGPIQSFMEVEPAEDKNKILILEEAEQFTKDAQKAFKNMLESTEYNCRVIFLTNNPEKIIDPIQSRCACYGFKPISEENVRAFIQKICKKEDIKITPQAVAALASESSGDLRKTLRTLEDLCLLDKKINVQDIRESYDHVKESISDIMASISAGHFLQAIRTAHQFLKQSGIPFRKFIKSLNVYLINLETFPPMSLVWVAEAEKALVAGGTDVIHLDAMIVRLCEEFKKVK